MKTRILSRLRLGQAAAGARHRSSRLRINAVSSHVLPVLGLAGAVPLLVLFAPFAQAAGHAAHPPGGRATRHTLHATIREVDIRTGAVPSAGSTATAAATVASAPGGPGAQVTHLKFTGPTGAPATFGFTGNATAFFDHGSISFTFKGTLAIGQSGSLRFAGQGKINGGTDRYAGATGRITFSGTAPNAAPGHVDTFRYIGTIAY